MDRSKHTPTPWRYGSPADAIVAGDANSDAPGVMYYGGTLVAESADHADREFIIRACNSHDALVAALKGMIALAEQMNDVSDEGGQLDERHDAAIAALAAAES